MTNEVALKAVGANGKRHDRDFYPTPSDVTESLIKFGCENGLFSDGETIWECAAGEGHMAQVFRQNGYDTISTDIVDGVDFLVSDLPFEDVDWIITNPPFNLSEQFIRHALELERSCAFLLKAQYWHARKRLELFREHPPTYILPLTWRPDFTGQGASLMDMMWCVWLPSPVIKETIYMPLERSKQTDV